MPDDPSNPGSITGLHAFVHDGSTMIDIGTLSGTLVRTTDASGIATFNDLSLTLAGAKTLAASSGALSTGDSATFNISPATAARLTILTQPSAAATAGAAFAQQPVIRIEDQFGPVQRSCEPSEGSIESE